MYVKRSLTYRVPVNYIFIMLPMKTDANLKRAKAINVGHHKSNWAAFTRSVDKRKVFK